MSQSHSNQIDNRKQFKSQVSLHRFSHVSTKVKKNQNHEYENNIKIQKWGFFKVPPSPEQYPDRAIINSIPDTDLPDNSIRTNKYTVFTFLPRNLFEQFSRLSNIYFLFISLLESIPEISNSDGQPVTFTALMLIIAISALKDILEDLKRYKSDQEENSKKVQVIDNNTKKIKTKLWKDLNVGDTVKIYKNEYFPADLFIIRTSEAKGGCFIETKNLDGETNLKSKCCINDIGNLFADEESFAQQKFLIKYEKPSNILYAFKGVIDVFDKSMEGVKYPGSIENLVLRGCSLRNTDYIYGIVLYTGHHTKIMLNTVASKSKKSTLEKMMNKQILIVFTVQLCFCVISSLWCTAWLLQYINEIPYVYPPNTIKASDNSFFLSFMLRYGNWVLIFTNFVPISLLVTLEMVRFAQGYKIQTDKNLYRKEIDTWAQVQCSALNEELGQVEYVFSDKTGTLTCNLMEYKKICVNGISYGDKKDIFDYSGFPTVTNVDFGDYQFIEFLRDEQHPQYQSIKRALIHLALNHTIITEKTSDGKIVYNASSPDELALVNFAKFCGVEFLGVDDNNNIKVSFKEKILLYKRLHVLEFNSTRKRNSTIVKDMQNRKIYLLCKGADSILLERMETKQDKYVNQTIKNLNGYGSIGLRTLLLSDKEISQEDYQQWVQSYEEAQSKLADREALIAQRQEEIEKGLKLVGATAIEDKLQDDVGLTIFKLKEAGIKVWVLTGDKLETAINIGFSCNLISPATIRLIVNEKTEQDVVFQLDEQYDKMINLRNEKLSEDVQTQIEFALVITGEALIHGLKSSIRHLIMRIASECRAVICCRVSPKQKADVVNLVRSAKPEVVTLAIGDGANDVNMITAAHVGVGIKGVEGYQAARAADFSMGEFKFLRRLLFYHGRENYRRNSNLICYNFFKNVLLVLPQFWFGFLNSFSGQQLFESYLYLLYNIVFASGPIVIYSIFDEEKKDYVLESQSVYYEQGIKKELFGFMIFWRWFSFGVLQAVIICYFVYFGQEQTFYNFLTDFWIEGVFCFLVCVVCVNLKIFIISYQVNLMSLGGIILSLIICTLAYYIVNLLPESELYDSMKQVYTLPSFYYIFLLIIVTTTFFDVSFENFIYIEKYSKIHEKITKKNFELIKKKTLFERKLSNVSNSMSLLNSSSAKLLQNLEDDVNIPEEQAQVQLKVHETWNLELIQNQENEENIRKIPLFNDMLAYTGYAFSQHESHTILNTKKKITNQN